MAREADVAHGTSADVTWHSRPHGRAARAHAELRWRDVAWTRGMGHTSPPDARVAPCGRAAGR